jgi:hypothetical protein
VHHRYAGPGGTDAGLTSTTAVQSVLWAPLLSSEPNINSLRFSVTLRQTRGARANDSSPDRQIGYLSYPITLRSKTIPT